LAWVLNGSISWQLYGQQLLWSGSGDRHSYAGMMKEPAGIDQPDAEDGRKDGGDSLAESDVTLSPTEAAPEERNDAHVGGLRQWATVILGLLVTLLFSGPIFGWASWQPMLEEDGVYRDLCKSSEPLCEARSSRMVLLYTVGQMAATMGLAVVSFLTDRAGPLFLVLAGGLLSSAGLLVMGQGGPLSTGPADVVDVLQIATILIGSGGACLIMHAMKLAFLVQSRYFPIVMTFANCLVDASAVVPVSFYQSYRMGLSRSSIFGFYAALCLGLTALLALSWCGAPLRTLEACNAAELRAGKEVEAGSSKHPRLHGLSVRRQCASLEFAFIMVVFTTQVFTSNSYLGYNKLLLESLGDAETDYAYVQIFTALLPASALLAPLYSLLLSKKGFAATFFVVIFLNITWNTVALVPSLQLQLMGFIAFTNFRALLFSTAFSFLGHTFGNRTFGTINGLCSLVTGGLSFLIWPCTDLSQRFFGSVSAMSVLLLTLCLPLILLNFRLAQFLRKHPAGDVCSQ